MYEIIISWWMANGTFQHEIFGAYRSEAVCHFYLHAELQMPGTRFRPDVVAALGGCVPKREGQP